MKINLFKILVCFCLISCTVATNTNERYTGYITELNYNNKTLILKVENKLINFELANYKLDIITLNHLNQHMLSGEPLSIESEKINGEYNITKISDIDGTMHGEPIQ